MCLLCYANKGKSQRFGKIINRISGIFMSLRLLAILNTHKVVYSKYKSQSLKNKSKICILQRLKDIYQVLSLTNYWSTKSNLNFRLVQLWKSRN